MVLKFTSLNAIGTFPIISYFYKVVISVFSDKFDRLPVFLIFISFFVIKILNHPARGIIRAIGAGFQFSFPEAAHLHLAFGLINVSFSAFISQLTPTTASICKCTTGFTICAAAPDIYYGHGILFWRLSI